MSFFILVTSQTLNVLPAVFKNGTPHDAKAVSFYRINEMFFSRNFVGNFSTNHWMVKDASEKVFLYF